MSAPDADITGLLSEYASGDRSAMDRLLPAVYDYLKRLAVRQRRVRQGDSLETTVIVHEAYLKLARNEGRSWKNRGHFFAVASKAMRQFVVDSARRKQAIKRGRDFTPADVEMLLPVAEDRRDDVLALDQALNRLAQESARAVHVVELRYFAGLSFEEVAEVTGTTSRTAKRDWDKARAFLHVALSERT